MQQPVTKQRELQQAVCQIPGTPPDTCFHVASLWCLVIRDSTFHPSYDLSVPRSNQFSRISYYILTIAQRESALWRFNTTPTWVAEGESKCTYKSYTSRSFTCYPWKDVIRGLYVVLRPTYWSVFAAQISVSRGANMVVVFHEDLLSIHPPIQ